MNRHIHQTIMNVLMWLLWLVILFGIATIITFAYVPKPDVNKWLFEFHWLVTLFVLLAIPISVRFLLIPKLKNPWLIFLIFIIGVFFGECIAVIGMFALLNGQNTYILSGVITILLFCPHWLTSDKKVSIGTGEQSPEV
jgi:uncharacterized membrane protein